MVNELLLKNIFLLFTRADNKTSPWLFLRFDPQGRYIKLSTEENLLKLYNHEIYVYNTRIYSIYIIFWCHLERTFGTVQ